MDKQCGKCGGETDFLSPGKIASLSAQIKMEPSLAASETAYRRRIKACEECDSLREKVLCFHCGCFVVIRARTAKNYCPHPAGDRWEFL